MSVLQAAAKQGADKPEQELKYKAGSTGTPA